MTEEEILAKLKEADAAGDQTGFDFYANELKVQYPDTYSEMFGAELPALPKGWTQDENGIAYDPDGTAYRPGMSAQGETIWEKMGPTQAKAVSPKEKATSAIVERRGSRYVRVYRDEAGNEVYSEDAGEVKPEAPRLIKQVETDPDTGIIWEVSYTEMGEEVSRKRLASLPKKAAEPSKGSFETLAKAEAAYPDRSKYDIAPASDGRYYVTPRPPEKAEKPTTPPVRGTGRAPDGRPLEDIRMRPDGSSYYYVLDSVGNATIQEVDPATKLTPYQQAQLSEGQAQWVRERAAKQADEDRAAATQQGLAALDYNYRTFQEQQADERAKRQEALTLQGQAASERQAERSLAFQREESAANRTEARNQRLAAMAQNPAMWLMRDIEAGVSPVVQPFMVPLGVNKPVGTPIDLYQRPEPQMSGADESPGGISGSLTPDEMTAINAERGRAAGQQGLIPQVTRPGQELRPYETEAIKAGRYGSSVGQPVLNPQAMLPALARPSGQLLGTFGPTAEAMYYGYEQARTGASPQEQRFRLASYNPVRTRALNFRR